MSNAISCIWVLKITRGVRNIVDGSLVHCHDCCEFEPPNHTFFLLNLYIN